MSVWPLVAVLLVITLWVVMKELKKPKLKVATLPLRRTGIAHILFEKRWHPFVTAVLIGLIALLAWPLSEATGRMFGLGITSPTANILQFLVAGDVKYINWGVFLVLGIFVGSFIAAKASREFRVRAADAQTTLRSGLGGVLMGFGASIAGGCSIGNGLVMTAMMTWQGWIGLVFMRILSDPGFWHSLWMTVWYTALVVAGSTVLGLAVAMFFNREFRLRKTARSLVILSYVTPSISLVFAWKYMFNNGYGIVNYLGVDLLHLYEQAPLWFDNPGSSFVLVVLFAIWRYFPYAFISFLAILQTIDKSLYEAAEMDGANAWQRFRIVTLPAIMPVLATVVTLRTIWMFYMFADVYLLTTKVDILGVYLYKTAFAFNDLGKALPGTDPCIFRCSGLHHMRQ